MATNLKPQPFQYAPQTIKRAQRALSCSPFRLKLFQQMRNDSVPMQQIAEETGISKGFTKQAMNEPQAETELVWLINVGLLRREVDGQGLTDSFRLTPLGRQIVEKWEQAKNEIPEASSIDGVLNWLSRWLKLSWGG
ncbi:MAG: Npun_F0494 family protein [Cyanobacteria bacterium P01_A01_bin.83]